LLDQPHREEDQQRLSEWLIAPELVCKPRSDDPRQEAYRDGGGGPHTKNLWQGVLPYGRIPIYFLIGSRGRRRRHRAHLFFCDPTISKAKRQYKV
jgi:hypothetical protein